MDIPKSDSTPLQAVTRAIELLCNEQDLLAAIEQSLRIIGEAAHQDRAYLFEVHHDSTSNRMLMSQRCEWVRDGIPSEIQNPDLIHQDFLKALPRWHDAFFKGESISGLVRDFPENEQELLLPQGIKSLLVVPIFDAKYLRGFIGFDNCRERYIWSEEDKALLKTIAAVIGSSMGREKTLRKLKDGEERFRKIITENPAIAVQGFTEDGTITFWNRASEDMYGYESAEVIGRDIFKLLLSAESIPHYRNLFLELEKDEQSTPVETEYRHKDGHFIPALSSLMALKREGKDLEYFTFDINLTEQKILEAQLLRAQRLEAIGSLTSGITHDLNNILSPLMMAVDMLKLQNNEDAHQLTLLDMMEKNILRASHMSYQLLSFAKGMDGKFEKVDLKEVLLELLDLMRNTLPRNIEMEHDLPESLPHLTGDQTQLHQVFLNLIVNARDAMPDGGKLRLTVHEDELYTPPFEAMGNLLIPGPHLVATLTDTGVGMSSQTQMKIFEPFYTTKGAKQGTGLGLSTSLAILKSHKGWVKLSSKPGKGTTFTIFLPVNGKIDIVNSNNTQQEPLPKGNRERILVVDDEKDIRDVTKHILEQYNYEVVTAENGNQAIELFKQDPEIRLVITDLMMPVMDGRTAMRQVKKLSPHTPLLATSGLSSSLAGMSQPPEEADLFIAKPFQSDILLKAVHHLLSSSDDQSA
ncbi:MAG: ATP-binding protein [Kiritimatiellae bacterium]|nr:ATP-binding protein [Kiritimatiellia bacterium]